VGGIRLRTYDGLINAYQDLGFGRLDAVFNDYPIAIYYSKPNPKLKFTGPPVERVLYAIGLRKEDKDLLKQINDALLELMKSANCAVFMRNGALE
jgi:polar amino acid transport system substrate-binding protein